MSKTLRIVSTLIFILLSALVVIPWVFKGRIVELVKNEADKRLKGELTIDRANLSMIKDFPNLTLTLRESAFLGEGVFLDKELFDIDKLSVTIDLFSFLKGDGIEINKIHLADALIRTIILENGEVNYDILKEYKDKKASKETKASSDANFRVSVNKVGMRNVDLIYEDELNKVDSRIERLSGELSGDFSQSSSNVHAEVQTQSAHLKYGSIPYLSNTTIDINIDALYTANPHKIALEKNKVLINGLPIELQGWFELLENSTNLDLTFESPSATFAQVLSLVPAVYNHHFDDVDATGDFELTGSAKGEYKYGSEEYPALQISSNIKNGYFKYSNLSESVKDVSMDLHLDHPGGDMDKMELSVQNARATIAQSPFSASLRTHNMVSDPYLDVFVETNLDFTKLSSTLELEYEKLQGLVDANFSASGYLSQFSTQKLSKAKAEGYINGKNIALKKEDLDISIPLFETRLSPQNLSINPLNLLVNGSDIAASGTLYNMLAYAMKGETLRGDFTTMSQEVDLNQLMSLVTQSNEGVDETAKDDTSDTTMQTSIPENIDIQLRTEIDRLTYGNTQYKGVKGSLHIKDGTADLQNLEMDAFGGKFLVNGKYGTSNNDPEVDLRLRLVDIDAPTSFAGMPILQSFAPIAKSATGLYGGELTFNSILGKDFQPKLESLKAKGNLKTKSLAFEPQILEEINSYAPGESFSNLKVADANLSFSITEGRATLKPLGIKIGGFDGTLQGYSGLDGQVDLALKTNLPFEQLKLTKVLEKLPITSGAVPVTFQISGPIQKPSIKPLFGEGLTLAESVDKLVDDAVNQAKDSALNIVSEKREKYLEEAKIEADRIRAEAFKASERIQQDAQKRADLLKQEAQNQADKLIEEASGNPLKKLAVQKSSELILQKADKKVEKLLEQAENQADSLMSKGEKKAQAVLTEAENKSDIKGGN